MVQKFMFQFFMLYPHKVCVDKGVSCPTCYLFLRSSFVLEWFGCIFCGCNGVHHIGSEMSDSELRLRCECMVAK